MQIHIGNFPRDVEGCVLVGTAYAQDTVMHSGQAYKLLKAAYDASANKAVRVKFQGVLATPWGDCPPAKSAIA